VSLGKAKASREYLLSVVPAAFGNGDGEKGKTVSKKELSETIQGVADSLSEDDEGKTLVLPDSTASGVKLVWQRPLDTAGFIAAAVLAALCYLIYRSRYRSADREIERLRAEMADDFPGFLSKLVLLLGAGMVITAALARIADDYEKRRRAGEERPFYEELSAMISRVRGSNSALTAEFSDLAIRSGARELMRFSSVLADNIDKGSGLLDKLSQEEAALRMADVKRAEAKMRVAETKLTFPLALQLIAVILITVAPAMMSM
jgi:Flp pilus assembly protein TadB